MIPAGQDATEKKKSGFFSRLKNAVAKTRDVLNTPVEEIFTLKKAIDKSTLESLEMALLGADIGPATTSHLIEKIRDQASRQGLKDAAEVKSLIRNELLKVVRGETAHPVSLTQKPHVIIIVGVNGVGKTTTIGKLANQFRRDGRSVKICAADTFRAAAVEQLEIWGQRAGVEIVRQKHGADPSAVLFDALKASKAAHTDVVIVDTAGRLHTKHNLMQELEKMRRIAAREVEGAPHEVLLVIDAVTGQNGVQQAREFTKSAGVTGIVLTKLDGTAKGGVVVAIAKELNIPIQFVGVGEKIDDLIPFDAEEFVDSLFE
ncbi:MAG: signal recognition particle-docking protein FtsY [Acidobacteriia bacterium]|nr:signal recognition particle-docking protein FtsY [Terriglobia bacterium]